MKTQVARFRCLTCWMRQEEDFPAHFFLQKQKCRIWSKVSAKTKKWPERRFFMESRFGFWKWFWILVKMLLKIVGGMSHKHWIPRAQFNFWIANGNNFTRGLRCDGRFSPHRSKSPLSTPNRSTFHGKVLIAASVARYARDKLVARQRNKSEGSQSAEQKLKLIRRKTAFGENKYFPPSYRTQRLRIKFSWCPDSVCPKI